MDTSTPSPRFHGRNKLDTNDVKILGRAWDLHVYCVGISCLILMIMAVWSLRAALKSTKLKCKEYFVWLNVLLALFGGLRSAYLLIDAYNVSGIFPDVVDVILLETGFPCLTAAFYVVLAALFQITLPLRETETKVLKTKWLFGVILTILASSLTVNISVGLFHASEVLLVVTEICFVIVNIGFSSGFFVIFFRLNCWTWENPERHRFSTSTASTRTGSNRLSSVSETVSNREAKSSISHTVSPIPSPMLTVPLTPTSQPRSSNASSDVKITPTKSDDSSREQTKNVLGKTMILSAVTASFFLLNAVAHIASIYWKIVYSDGRRLDAWLWWVQVTTVRTTELCTAFTLLYMAAGRGRRRRCRHHHEREWGFRKGGFRSGKTVEVSSETDSMQGEMLSRKDIINTGRWTRNVDAVDS